MPERPTYLTYDAVGGAANLGRNYGPVWPGSADVWAYEMKRK